LGRAKIKRESLTQISESQQALAIYFTMGKTTDSMAAWGEHGARRFGAGTDWHEKARSSFSSERARRVELAVGVSGSE
jgi:hypothetical protein